MFKTIGATFLFSLVCSAIVTWFIADFGNLWANPDSHHEARVIGLAVILISLLPFAYVGIQWAIAARKGKQIDQ